MKQIIVLCLMLASLAFSQKQVAVLKSLTDRESKVTPEQLNLLSQEVYAVASNELPRDKFALMSLDDVEKKLGPQTYFDACSETECVKTFVDQLGIDYGARCDIISSDKQLYLSCELYGTETGNIAKIPPEQVKNIDDARSKIRKEVPAMFHKLTKTPRELCTAEGKTWMKDNTCKSDEELCTDEGGIWNAKEKDCQSEKQKSCALKKGYKWESKRCKSPEEQECDKKGQEWDEENEKCIKPAVAVAPVIAPAPIAIAPTTGGGNTFSARVHTDPKGASVYVNGNLTCNGTPCDISVYERNVSITAAMSEHDNTDTTLTLTTPGQMVNIKLKPKTYFVNFYSEPSEVELTLEGHGKCQTPCVWYLTKGNVKVSALDEYYERKDTVIFISEESHINLKLNPNYGVLNINPAYSDSIGKNESWNLTIDDKSFPFGANKLLPGNHKIKLSHNCYEDIKIDNVKINKNGRMDFDMQGKLALKQGGLVLKAERYYSSLFSGFNKSVSMPFSVNGKVAGETAFNGSVPLCSEIEINSEKIDAKLESGSTAEYTYKMRSYLPTIISGIVGTALFAYGLYRNSELENVYMKEYADMEAKNDWDEDQLKGEYNKSWDKVASIESARNLAYILGGVSFALGVVLWF